MVGFRALRIGSLVVPLPNGFYKSLINGGDPNHLKSTGMILQVCSVRTVKRQ